MNEEIEICIGATTSGKIHVSIASNTKEVAKIVTVEEARRMIQLIDSAIDLATRAPNQ